MARVRFAAVLTCLASAAALAGPLAADEQPVEFERDVRPLLAARCGKCHGEQVHKGGLNLASPEGIRAGGESGDPLVTADLAGSLLWTMIDGGGMPPESEPPMTSAELALLRRWIESGAAVRDVQPARDRPPHQHDVLPILLLRCTTCHGARLQAGGLDLRTPQAMLAGGRSGPALHPGDAAGSLMIQRIESGACPPQEMLLKFFVKRPPASELEVLTRWIDAGAPEIDIPPDVATTEPDPLVSDDDRQHWAFQPPRPPEQGACVDDFIAAQLQRRGLDFSPPADRDTLIRRAYFDLTGLPPGPDELQRWRTRADDGWFSALVDELLDSPRYGERWGRYWLDLAGYADSEGGVSADPVRTVAWKYRDYVVRAFNDDKPYDRFLLEQIAGDELIDCERAETVTPEMVENLIATGFLRMGIDQTGSRTMNFVPERLGVVHDAITVLGSGVLGLTLECARCHSHKYDPIPQRDYYRFKAILQGALDEHDWLSFKDRSLELATPEHRQRVQATNPPLAKELKSLQSELRRRTNDWRLELLRVHYPDQSDEDRRATIAALPIADNNRTLKQRNLVELLQIAEALPDHEQPPEILAARAQVAELEQRMEAVRRSMQPPLEIRALWDRGEPSPTYVLLRGEYNRPGRLVGPGVPSVLTDGRTPFVVEPPFPDGTPKTGRRLALARWLTQPEQPLTARVLVNRLWYHHFGAGLVATLENFGVKGERPSHPELLDWLAIEFPRRGWSIKEMHRLMMNSRTYQQTSRVTDQHFALDPANRWLSRMPLRRLDAEALHDALLAVAGRLDLEAEGPPDPVTVDRFGQVSVNPTAAGRWRRSLYAQYRRTEIPSMMEAFDYPEMGPNCIARSVSTISPQSLLLMNNRQVHDLAAAFAERVQQLTAQRSRPDPQDCVVVAYEIALSRSPGEVELALGAAALRELEQEWAGDRRAALTTYCHALLNSAAFLYVD